MKELLSQHTRYNFWANQRVCDFLKNNLSEEQINTEIKSSFPSLKKTMLHAWDAQFIWLKRLSGTSLTSFPGKNFNGTSEDMMSGLLATSQELVGVVENNNEEFLSSQLIYKNIKGDEFKSNVSDIILHVVNHGTYHRGQLITMLHQLGFAKLFPTDYIAFFR